MKNEISISFFIYHFKIIIIQANLKQSYKNYLILNAYNFLYKIYFENLTSSSIKLISKNKITSFIFSKFYFFKNIIKRKMAESVKILTADYLNWHAKLTGLPSILTDKIRSKLYKDIK